MMFINNDKIYTNKRVSRLRIGKIDKLDDGTRYFMFTDGGSVSFNETDIKLIHQLLSEERYKVMV